VVDQRDVEGAVEGADERRRRRQRVARNYPAGATLEPLPPGDHGVVLSGVVRHSETNQILPGALVVLQCSCLTGGREMWTDKHGLYRFQELPAGKYTVEVLIHDARVTKTMDVPAGHRFRANFALDPETRFSVT
jgi:hypothetical protein